ncbi:MAG TPA: MFS transporter [Polyangia bacterium]|nr:MFS transporter [Polyangia bacterium]
MTSAAAAAPSASRPALPAVPRWKWTVVVMLLLATVVNYMDRQALGSLSSFIKRDFRLGEEGYGSIEAWFGYSYAVFLVVSGFLADRLDLRWLYAGALLVWSGAGFATGFATTLLGLQLCRIVLAAAEAFNWPVAVGVVKRLFPREQQSFANSVFNTGVTFGAVFTPLLVIAMVGPGGSGWRAVFKAVGVAGLLVLGLWLWSTRGSRAMEMALPPREEGAGAARVPGVPFWAVLRMRRFWITMGVGFSANFTWHLYRVWLPRHLVVDLRFDDRQLQWLLIAFYRTAALGSVVIGYLSRRLVGPGRSVDRARKIVVVVSAALCLVATPLLAQPGRAVMVPLYCLVGAGTMGMFAMFYSLVQDISPGHTSKCLGLIGATVWFVVSRLHGPVGHYADTHAPTIGKFAALLLVAGTLPLAAALFALTWPEKRDTT